METKNLYPNVVRIAKDKKMELGDVERTVGVSLGFFSRLKKQPNRGISVGTVIKLSEVLNVTLDELLNEPPVRTNRVVFFEVFGFNITDHFLPSHDIYSWLEEPYKEKK